MAGSATSIVSLLLVTGCSPGGLRPHDKLTCRRFASEAAAIIELAPARPRPDVTILLKSHAVQAAPPGSRTCG